MKNISSIIILTPTKAQQNAWASEKQEFRLAPASTN
jgi:hypothetical protein